LVVLALVHVFFKLIIAYDQCAGGVPLLYGYIFPPIFLGVGSAIFFHSLQIDASGYVVAVAALIFVFGAYQIAWRLGARRKR
jgi:hypothetical protein